MYQQQQNNKQFQNQNFVPNRNTQNVSQALSFPGNQQTSTQYRNFSFINKNLQNDGAGPSSGSVRNMPSQYFNNFPHFHQNRFAHNSSVLETNVFRNNENVSNQGFRNSILTERNNPTSTVVRPTQNFSSNHGNSAFNTVNNAYNQQNGGRSVNTQIYKSLENIQPGVFMPCPSPGMVNLQTNRNFNTHYATEEGTRENRLAVKRDDKSDRKSVASNNDSVRSAAWTSTGGNNNQKIRIFTGTAEKIIKWHKIYKDYFCFYELVASIISIQEGTVRLQKIMLLRDRNGPIIQVIHYVNDHIKIENFFVGQMLRCVGHMVGPNILHGLSIREATPDEVTTLRRMCYISEHAISKALSKPQLQM